MYRFSSVLRKLNGNFILTPTVPVPELAEGSNSDTESHGKDEGAAEICSSAPYSSDSDTDSS